MRRSRGRQTEERPAHAAPHPGRLRPGDSGLFLSALDDDLQPGDHAAVARVELSAHLRDVFPELGGDPLEVSATDVAHLIDELEKKRPGIAFYLCDELGRLRRHVNVFVDGEMIIDRPRLSDPLKHASTVFIAQALSGG